MKQKKTQQPRRRPNYNALVNTSYQPTVTKSSQKSADEPKRPKNNTPVDSNEEKKKFWTIKKKLLVIFLVILTPFIVIGIWDLRNLSNATSKMFGTNNAFAVLAQKPPKSTDNRTNILLIGYSADDPNHGGATLTDSIMVLSLSKDKENYMLSIPRDLYVQIPGEGRAKINEAYQDGERSSFSEEGYFDGGVGLLQKTITEKMGLEIHNYALVDYAAVREIVDALDGITVNINSPDERGIYDANFQPIEGGPLELTNGEHHIDGQTALRLTRARGATNKSYGFPQSDFNRTQNQQQVLSAIKNEMNWKLVLDPRKNGKIFSALGNNVQTNVAIEEVIPMYRMFIKTPDSQIKSVVLNDIGGKNLLKGYRTSSGQSALIPASGINNYEDIQAAIRAL